MVQLGNLVPQIRQIWSGTCILETLLDVRYLFLLFVDVPVGVVVVVIPVMLLLLLFAS